jgi:hypothetical protein
MGYDDGACQPLSPRAEVRPDCTGPRASNGAKQKSPRDDPE